MSVAAKPFSRSWRAWAAAASSTLRGRSRPDFFEKVVDAAGGEIVGDEAVPEGGIVGVDVEGSVDQMCAIPITLCQGLIVAIDFGFEVHLGGAAIALPRPTCSHEHSRPRWRGG